MIPTLITTVQGNFGFAWKFTLTDAQGAIVDISSATSVIFDCKLTSDPTVNFQGNMTIVDGPNGICQYTVNQNDFIVSGIYNAQVKVIYGLTEALSFPSDQPITIEVTPKIP